MGKYLDALSEVSKNKSSEAIMRSSIETVTPEMAASYLANNEGNRNVRTMRVKELSGIIQRGEWMVTHQGIAFSRDGRLLDGQHRLLACIDANMPIKIMVTRNVDPQAFSVLDLHGKRSFSDIFGISTNLAACFNFIATAFYGLKISPAQIQIVMGTELGRTCASLCCASHNSAIVRTPWIVGCAVQCVMGNREYATNLFENIRMCNTGLLPPIGEAFLRQHMNGGLRHANNIKERRELFARAVILFDPKKRQNTIVKAMAIDAAMQMLRDAVPEIGGAF